MGSTWGDQACSPKPKEVLLPAYVLDAFAMRDLYEAPLPTRQEVYR